MWELPSLIEVQYWIRKRNSANVILDLESYFHQELKGNLYMYNFDVAFKNFFF